MRSESPRIQLTRRLRAAYLWTKRARVHRRFAPEPSALAVLHVAGRIEAPTDVLTQCLADATRRSVGLVRFSVERYLRNPLDVSDLLDLELKLARTALLKQRGALKRRNG